MILRNKKVENILSKFTKEIILQVDNNGEIQEIVLNTEQKIPFKDIKNVSEMFSKSEQERLKRLIQYPSTQPQYLELSKEYKGEKFVNVQITEDANKKYISLTIPKNISNEEIYQKKEIEELKDISQTDQLTKVLNRYGLLKKAQKIIEKSDPLKRIGLAFIDIDNLKQINDTYGHIAGDESIKSIVKIVKETIRSRDLFARIGGDEFLVMVEEVSGRKSSVYGLAERLLNKIPLQKEEHSTTISIGVHMFKTGKFKSCVNDTNDFEKCFFEEIDKADKAAYIAKKAGKNQLSVSTNFEKYYKTLSKASA